MEPSLEQFFGLIFKDLPANKFLYFTQIHKSVQHARPRFIRETAELITAVKSLEANGKLDFYFSPAYYHRPTRPLKTNVFGSSFAWVDCDSTLPEFEETPSVLVQTSPGHFHAYWNLGSCFSGSDVESINRNLAYRYNMDKSGWDSTQLLRPPGSLNRKRDNFQSAIVGWNPDQIVDFTDLIDSAPKGQLVSTGGPEALFAKLTFTQRVRELLFEKEEASNGEGRSGVLYELACELVAMKLPNGEISQLLIYTDKRLGKFQTRADPESAIEDLIKTVRSKKGIAPPVENVTSKPPYQVYIGTTHFSESVGEAEACVLDAFVPEQGIVMVGGDPGIGKSRFCLHMMESIAIGEPFLNRKVDHPRRVGFLSIDMPSQRLKHILDYQVKNLPPEKRHLLEENAVIFDRGYGWNIADPRNQAQLEADILGHEVEYLTIDNLSRAVTSMNNDDEAAVLLDWLQSLRLSYCLVTHTRKSPPASKTQNILDDLFGTRQWSITPDTCLMLAGGHKAQDQKLYVLKDRLGQLPFSMVIRKPRETSLYELVSEQGYEPEESESGSGNDDNNPDVNGIPL